MSDTNALERISELTRLLYSELDRRPSEPRFIDPNTAIFGIEEELRKTRTLRQEVERIIELLGGRCETLTGSSSCIKSHYSTLINYSNHRCCTVCMLRLALELPETQAETL